MIVNIMSINRGVKMKVGIIRCAQTEDYCPGTTDFLMIKERKGAFEGIIEDIDIIGFVNCGGCPAKKAVMRAKELVKRGADTIVDVRSCRIERRQGTTVRGLG